MLSKTLENLWKFLGISKEKTKEKTTNKGVRLYSQPTWGEYTGIKIFIFDEDNKALCSFIIAEGERLFDTKAQLSLIGFAFQKQDDPHGTSIVTISKANVVDAAHMIAYSVRTVAEKDFRIDLSEVDKYLAQRIERYVVNQWTTCGRP